MNPLVRRVMQECVRQAQEFSDIAAAIPHAGLVGQFRESFLSRAIRPWLPDGFQIGSGTIIDRDGSRRRVNEDDIVIHQPSLLPPLLPLLHNNIYLLDSVVAVVEVKSTLSSQELLDACHSMASVAHLTPGYRGEREIRAIYAYRSTASEKSELVRLLQQMAKVETSLDAPPVCLLGIHQKECFMFGSQGVRKDECWYDLGANGANDPTVAFISALTSGLLQVSSGRSGVQLGKYACDFDAAVRVDSTETQ